MHGLDHYLFIFSTGDFGLWIDENLERGHTARTTTFNNEPLVGSSDFICLSLEVWAVLDATPKAATMP